ncbi:hypothetical protein SNF32_07360 [Enterococcus mundtii]|nr:hypothetical protein [Enterococcus mundtii]
MLLIPGFWIVDASARRNDCENDDWYKVEGTIQTDFYQPFKREIPSVVVTKVEKSLLLKINMCIVHFK